MLKNMSSFFVRTLREDPADAEVTSHKLLVRAGYIRRTAPGIYTWLPLGLQVLKRIEKVVREEMDAVGAQEVHFPALLPAEPYQKTNRWEEYGPTLFKLRDRKAADYLLAPTHEEMFTLLVKDMYSSYKDLPVTLYQIQTKYRDEARPRAGLIRGREFVMKDAYSFDIDQEGLNTSYDLQRQAYQRIFERLGLEYVICSAMSGAMGGSRSEEFLHPCEIGEDTFVRSPGGYAANAEAVTTPVPAPVDATNVPAFSVHETPGAKTMEALVEYSNEHYPRAEGDWTAANMLKSVVVALTHPDGEREVMVIAIPGDREVDMKRVEAAVSPAEVEMASAADFENHPELVAGYLGPQACGPNSPLRTVDEDGKISGSVRLLVDPRVVEGTSWIAGGNEVDKHVYNLVMGRDFTADGTIEAAEIREGDPAPDGSGPLELARGIEIGHIFQLGKKYAEALDLKVLDQNGKTQVVTMGSYGVGVSRVLAALAESCNDENGLAWPMILAPFHLQVLATGKGEELFETAGSIAKAVSDAGFDVLYDDRPKVSAGVKFADAELLGMPYVLVVGRGLKDGVVELRDRRNGTAVELPVAEASAEILRVLEENRESNR
ncbi:proline--tRNA ligase [Gleimia coleocanis DSM 15436]|uniref:Proline--tRNA ligase n=1 Tax=Gleimia coleocanis DSM 15436 TaxID=525245 RepID=C0W055_9ACTO|nr:proline--tRNA ligase [Gleimia coleocanis]EEH63914.1 proline--tRNA ligase [Gleimia coleocanis DSM 15436]